MMLMEQNASPQPDKDTCREYLLWAINYPSKFKASDTESSDYLARNLLFYAWVLQRSKGIIQENELIPLIGMSIEQLIRKDLKDLEHVRRFISRKRESDKF